ncbi:MAG: hypothetical protein ACXV76_13120 [Halobacteriota archaeon]
MIDTEKINEKYLIALQALQDIMNEVEQLPKEFKGYLTEIKEWETNWRVSELLSEFKALPLKGEVKDIFVSNDKDIAPKSLWFFLEGYCLEAKNFLEKGKGLEETQITSLKGEPEWINVKKQNFNIDTGSKTPYEQTQPKLQISVKLEEDRILSLSAVNIDNCRHLLKIYRTYFAPISQI